MVAHLLRRLAARRSAARAEQVAAMRADLDQRLADRRQGREERNKRARKSAATRVHQAWAGDPLLHGPMDF